MLKASVLLVCLLGAAMAWSHCPNCKPATHVATCPDYHCYRCGLNEFLNLNTMWCECEKGYYRINGVCGVCPPGYVYDEVLQWCEGENPCGINQVLNSQGVCECQPGLQVIQNICQGCPVNQTYFPEFDACRCQVGYSLVNGTCTLVECGINEEYSIDSQACICTFGFYRIAGVCDRCPSHQTYDGANQACVDIQVPMCGWHEYFYECCCFCQNGYVRIHGQCVTCPEHSSFNWNLNACVCDPGWYFVGEEIRRLPPSYFDTGSSLLSNPTYIYMAYGPTTGFGNTQLLTQYSNHDGGTNTGINRNGVNINNVYDPYSYGYNLP